MALKTTLEDAKDRLDALLTYANGVTGEADTNIGDAIAELAQQLADERAFENWLISNGSDYGEYVNDTLTNANIMEYTFYNRKIGKVRFTGAVTPRGRAFMGCKATEIHLPNASGVQAESFRNCPNLQVCDIGKINVLYQLFASSPNVETIIIRKSSLIEPSGATIFADTKLAPNGSGGHVYVPQALLSQYQASQAWADYANVTFHAIEGSIYELDE